ncbi:MAG: flagellar hook-basal body complex protein FliE [Brevundimonas sp.]|jgi:flagellar hook-basal body complex protein FliE|uniref:flagellar hook-basal body complex protein FliE n=1 Tax=Brevundimonas sp. TaxID=1871086 RepID=UPI002ABAF97C|nr:flagellar hook-basal body complex protein FliE [Brevundimonas sp.]MDZ4108224.1 flagellar hook-basal body complex protein FliE [Brevundimonas sp.]
MNPIAAARAYQAIQGAGSAGAVSPTDAPGFSELVQNVLASATTQTRAAETQMTQVVQGQGSLIDVVTAISSAEASLETALAVRDQMIQAYQEIMRMPI